MRNTKSSFVLITAFVLAVMPAGLAITSAHAQAQAQAQSGAAS